MKANSLGTKLIVDEVSVGALTSINGIDVTADEIDLSSLDNQDGYREFEQDLKTVNDVTGSGFLDAEDAGQLKCMELLNSGATVPCSIVFPPKINATWSFNAFLKRFSTGAEMGSGVKFDITLKPTGKPTLAPTTPAAQGGGGNG